MAVVGGKGRGNLRGEEVEGGLAPDIGHSARRRGAAGAPRCRRRSGLRGPWCRPTSAGCRARRAGARAARLIRSMRARRSEVFRPTAMILVTRPARVDDALRLPGHPIPRAIGEADAKLEVEGARHGAAWPRSDRAASATSSGWTQLEGGLEGRRAARRARSPSTSRTWPVWRQPSGTHIQLADGHAGQIQRQAQSRLGLRWAGDREAAPIGYLAPVRRLRVRRDAHGSSAGRSPALSNCRAVRAAIIHPITLPMARSRSEPDP